MQCNPLIRPFIPPYFTYQSYPHSSSTGPIHVVLKEWIVSVLPCHQVAIKVEQLLSNPIGNKCKFFFDTPIFDTIHCLVPTLHPDLNSFKRPHLLKVYLGKYTFYVLSYLDNHDKNCCCKVVFKALVIHFQNCDS